MSLQQIQKNITKKDFFSFLSDEKNLDFITVSDLEAWLSTFHFFQLGQMVLSKKYQREKNLKFNNHLKYTASIAHSRAILQRFLSNFLENHPQEEALTTPQSVISSSTITLAKPAKTQNYDLENLYPEEKSRGSLDEWLENLKIKRQETLKQQRSQQSKREVTETVSKEEDALVSDTLAKIYELQENWEKALHAYEVLLTKKPEKREFYLSRIEFIKNKQSI